MYNQKERDKWQTWFEIEWFRLQLKFALLQEENYEKALAKVFSSMDVEKIVWLLHQIEKRH